MIINNPLKDRNIYYSVGMAYTSSDYSVITDMHTIQERYGVKTIERWIPGTDYNRDYLFKGVTAVVISSVHFDRGGILDVSKGVYSEIEHAFEKELSIYCEVDTGDLVKINSIFCNDPDDWKKYYGNATFNPSFNIKYELSKLKHEAETLARKQEKEDDFLIF